MEYKSVKPAELPALCWATFKAGMIPLVVGQPGAGKTAMGPIIAAICGCLRYLKFSPVGKGPQEVLGYGIPNPETGEMKFSRPEDLPTAGDEPELFMIDELPNADGSVIAEFHSLTDPDRTGRRIGTHRIGSKVLPVITGNLRKHSRDVQVLTAPMVTRCVTLMVEPDVESWLTDFASGESATLPPLGEFPEVADVRLDESDHAKFLAFSAGTQEGDAHWSPEPVTPWDGMPYPTARGHEAACRVTHPDFPTYGDSATTRILLQGILGTDTAEATYAFSRAIMDALQPAKDILDGVSGATLPSEREKQYQTAVAAHRITKRKAGGANDAEAWVYAGGADSYVNNILEPASGEVRKYLVDLASRDKEFPLEKHETVKRWLQS